MNTKRGTVSFDVGGVSHSARLSTNAMIKYQDETGVSVLEAFSEMEKKNVDMKVIRDLLWVSVEGEHTKEEIGDLIDEMGFVEAARILGEAGKLAFPQTEKGDGAEAGNVKAGKAPRKTKTS